VQAGRSELARAPRAWLRRCLCQAAWAVSTKKNNYLSALYRRLAARRGKKRAIIAVAHALLQIAYYILRDGKCYRELGADYFDQLHPSRVKRYLVKRLERLGFQVSLVPAAQPA
jgi:transposase